MNISEWISVGNICVLVGTGGAIIWYTIETRMLRKTTQKQTNETQKLRETTQVQTKYNVIESRIKDLSESLEILDPQTSEKAYNYRNGDINILNDIVAEYGAITISKTLSSITKDANIPKAKEKLKICKELMQYRKKREQTLIELDKSSE